MCDSRGRRSNFVCVLLSLSSIEGGLWDAIVLITDHCLSIYFNIFAEYISASKVVNYEVILSNIRNTKYKAWVVSMLES